jgi:uncharacterized Zn-binding protein involved in type VI secretion
MSGIARQNDDVVAVDLHVPVSGGSPVSSPFNGQLRMSLATTVFANGLPVALDGTIALNIPPHVGVVAANKGTVSVTRNVLAEGRSVARQGDVVITCNEPVDHPAGRITTGSPDVVVG